VRGPGLKTRKKLEMEDQTPKVQLEMFEGPLDLLLHLIKKNEVAITDIPIATITEQYLATLDLMQGLNLDVAGEFLVMAATLVHIKSRMLLPADESAEGEEEGEDSREELIQRLLEYQRFKEAAEELEQKEILMRDVFARPVAGGEDTQPVEFEAVSLFDLLSALRQVIERVAGEWVHEVTLDTLTVREKMSWILENLHQRGRAVFQSLFDGATSRFEVVVTFLAVLELVKIRALKIRQEERLGPIILELAASLGEIQERMAKENIEGADGGA
jgi:segregation and condensation protein A